MPNMLSYQSSIKNINENSNNFIISKSNICSGNGVFTKKK